MSTHKHIDRICYVLLALTLCITALFMNGERLGLQKVSSATRYEAALFDTSRVHTIDIIMDNWDDFTENCKSEEYYNCTVVIDNEAFKNVAIRGKGNTSLSQVTNDRYSYKIEFDHYDSSNTYYGLDKLCLNNIIQDNTYVKDYLTYQMMSAAGVASPLCSFAYITVNGEDWGLYLAVEAVEDSFLQRNYGSDYGSLYKPESSQMGGGAAGGAGVNAGAGGGAGVNAGAGGGAGSDDVLLKYIDDNASSYSNIFENAKTNITSADQTRLISALKKLSNMEDLDSTVNVDEVIRYFVIHNFVLNFDSYTGSIIHNYYLYEQDGQLQMIPWDYNLAFGGFQSMGSASDLVNYSIDSPLSQGSTSDRPMIAWIFQNEEYTSLYHEYFEEFLSTYFDSGYFSNMLESLEEMISPYVEKDPTKFCTYEEFQKGISTLKEFCLLRAESVHNQLDGNSIAVEAGDISISDMGSMNNEMGGRPDRSDIQDFGDEAQGKFPGSDMRGPEDSDMQRPSGDMPQGGRMEQQEVSNYSSLLPGILLGASVLILASGLVFALLYRKRER